MSTSELMGLIGEMGRHYRQGGAGYTWLDVALDVASEHGYTILSDNGDGNRPAAIFIKDETLSSVCQMIDRLRQIGTAAAAAASGNLVELDEETSVIHETLSDLLVSLLVDAGLVERLVNSRDGDRITAE